MGEQKHTPGPWTVEDDDRDGMEWNRHIVEAGRPHHRVCFMTSDGPNEANARLIAAAPDMLAALQKAYAVLGSKELDAVFVFYAIHGMRYSGPTIDIAELRAAIAKASTDEKKVR